VITQQASDLLGEIHDRNPVVVPPALWADWLDCSGGEAADAERLLAAIPEADVAVASRYAPGGGDARDSRTRVLASRAINLFGTVCLAGPVRDWTSGFVAARREGLERVPLRTRYAYGDYCIDFLHRAGRAGLAVVEVPYRFVERRGGQTKTSPSLRRFAVLGLRYAATILQLRWETLSRREGHDPGKPAA
jgi:dolichol-phosphate mannosyltransferase